MDPVKLVAIFTENKSGQLARVTALLKEANINIRWVTIASSDTFGVIKLLVNEPDLAFRQLKHNALPVSLLEVVAVEVEDKPGGLWTVASVLGQAGVNIENASGIVTQGRAVLLIEVQDVARAKSTLQAQGLRLLSAQETLAL